MADRKPAPLPGCMDLRGVSLGTWGMRKRLGAEMWVLLPGLSPKPTERSHLCIPPGSEALASKAFAKTCRVSQQPILPLPQAAADSLSDFKFGEESGVSQQKNLKLPGFILPDSPAQDMRAQSSAVPSQRSARQWATQRSREDGPGGTTLLYRRRLLGPPTIKTSELSVLRNS